MTSTISPTQSQHTPPGGGAPPASQQPAGSDAAPAPRSNKLRREIPLSTLVADMVGLGGLGALGLYGFHTAYGGTSYFLAGVIGLVLGMAIAGFGARRRLSALSTALLVVVGYFVVGGVVVVPEDTIAGFIPQPASLAALADGAIAGWAKLLTAVPPVGSASHLLAVPFLCGLLCGLLALTVTLRTRKPLFALVFPVSVLVLSILFGTGDPAGLYVQGACFAVIAIAWASYRRQVGRRIDTGRRAGTRWVGAGAMLGLAALLAGLLGSSIPGANDDRFYLRDNTDPPFDPNQYPSPLVGYRNFTNGPADTANADESANRAGVGWRHTELLEVTGLPETERLRLATLDSYDGVVYRVGSGTESTGYFRKVGETITTPAEVADNDERTVQIEVLDPPAAEGSSAKPYNDIWMPLPENPTGIEFTSGDEERNTALAEALRLNDRTGAAALPPRLRAGDSYEVSYRSGRLGGETLSEEEQAGAELAESVSPELSYPEQVNKAAGGFAKGTAQAECRKQKAAAAGASESSQADAGDDAPAAPTGNGSPADGALNAVQKAYMIGTQLAEECGSLDDGAQSQGGHNASRLDQMATDVPIGNGEQFGPLGALMANAVGAPARVVMGFRPCAEAMEWREEHAELDLSTGCESYRPAGVDIDSWIEIKVAGYGWVPIDVTPTDTNPVVLPQPQPVDPENQPPPPPPSIPPSEEEEVDTETADPCEVENPPPDCDPPLEGFVFPWWIVKVAAIPLTPIAVVALITGLIAWLKLRRRNHRRNDGPPDARVKGGWEEITDLACDLGSPVPAKVTRREAAGLVANRDATHLARHADGAVFGPYDLSDGDVERYWHEVDSVRSSMVSDLSRFGRWKVLVSLTSLRLSAQRNRAARRAERAHGGRARPSGPSKPTGSSKPTDRGPTPPSDGVTDALLPGAAPGVTPDLGGGLR